MDNIPSFATKGLSWLQISKESAIALLKSAIRNGWREAVDEFFSGYLHDYVLDESRAQFSYMLPLERESRVLDLGSNWGAVTLGLARIYKHVIAADITLESLLFIRERAFQEGITNIDFVHIDPLEWSPLPFHDLEFDLVVMNGLLEWIGTSRTDASPSWYQRGALKEVKRVLKRGGGVYIGVENRFAYSYFLGALGHTGIPYIDLLPRNIANLLCRSRGFSYGYRNYIYGYFEYKKLLRLCGFRRLVFYIPWPTYREPKLVIPADQSKTLEYMMVNHVAQKPTSKALVTVLTKIGLAKYFVYSYGVYGEA
ncbi:MAG: class I SAM-dependent methyltransferase [archaeon]|nr:class I SAM-dependent methyltransferase [archaeon]MCP8314407.1 class I SAM-dependent methyltransferase [archaeon]MCP8317286.1 class I SAM-dependent methyltransferase [archaeon]MCP8319810.1 class I SAM-dependent methyltransferase [archaeon]